MRTSGADNFVEPTATCKGSVVGVRPVVADFLALIHPIIILPLILLGLISGLLLLP